MWYTYGKVSITNGSKTLKGTGTTWADNKQGIGIGHMVIIPGSGDVKVYQTARVVSNTEIELVTAYTGTNVTNGDYAIIDTIGETDPEMARRVAGALEFHQKAIPALADLATKPSGTVDVPMPDGSFKTVPTFQSQLPFYSWPTGNGLYYKVATMNYPETNFGRLMLMISGASDFGLTRNITEIIAMSARGLTSSSKITEGNVAAYLRHSVISAGSDGLPDTLKTRWFLRNSGSNIEVWVKNPNWLAAVGVTVLSHTPGTIKFHGEDGWNISLPATDPLEGAVQTPVSRSFFHGEVHEGTMKLTRGSSVLAELNPTNSDVNALEYRETGVSGLSGMSASGANKYPSGLATVFNCILSEHRAFQLVTPKSDITQFWGRHNNGQGNGWNGFVEFYTTARKPSASDIGAYRKEETYSRSETDTNFAARGSVTSGELGTLIANKSPGLYSSGMDITGTVLGGSWRTFLWNPHVMNSTGTLMEGNNTGQIGFQYMEGKTLKAGGWMVHKPPTDEYVSTIWGDNPDNSAQVTRLRRFRSYDAAVIWHETVKGDTYRISTGTSDSVTQFQIDYNSRLYTPCEFQTASQNGLRIRAGGIGAILRFNGDNLHFLFTDKGKETGDFNRLRPIAINAVTGKVTMGNGLESSQDITVRGNPVYHAGNKPSAADIGALANTGRNLLQNGVLDMDYPKIPQDNQYIYMNTSYDGNQPGGGGTHLAQWDGKVFNHFFRGAGAMNIDMTKGMHISKGWLLLEDSIHFNGWDINRAWMNQHTLSIPNIRIPSNNASQRNGTIRIWGSEPRPTVLEWGWDTGQNGGGNAEWSMFIERNWSQNNKFGVNGVVECVSLIQTSDIRLKSDIKSVKNPLGILRELGGYTYTLNRPDGVGTSSLTAGVIAQELEKVFPRAVSEQDYGERWKSVDYSSLSAVYVEAFKEIDDRVSILEGGAEQNITELKTGDEVRDGVYMISDFGRENKPTFEIPEGINGEKLIWVDYQMLNDTLMIKTFHRTHPSHPSFAQNVKDGYNEMDAIGIPDGHVLRVTKVAPSTTKETQ